ncbi:hypothetical protein [Virgibacillus sp. DJP39]
MEDFLIGESEKLLYEEEEWLIDENIFYMEIKEDIEKGKFKGYFSIAS